MGTRQEQIIYLFNRYKEKYPKRKGLWMQIEDEGVFVLVYLKEKTLNYYWSYERLNWWFHKITENENQHQSDGISRQ